MKFYDDTKLFYLDTDAPGIRLGAVLLQLRDNTTCQTHMAPDNTILHPMVFVSKSLTGAECRYCNIECKALGILHRLEKVYHYCFSAHYNGSQMASIYVSKDVATLSQHIQHILLKIHQYGVPDHIQTWP